MDNLEILNNEYFLATVMLFFIVYASLGQIDLPIWVADLFKNDIFKIAFLSLIVMIPAKQAPHVAILVAVVFVVTLNYLSQKEMKENFQILESFTGSLRNVKRVQKPLKRL
jgi:hypothetical protein